MFVVLPLITILSPLLSGADNSITATLGLG
jgi:hypothetical protein